MFAFVSASIFFAAYYHFYLQSKLKEDFNNLVQIALLVESPASIALYLSDPELTHEIESSLEQHYLITNAKLVNGDSQKQKNRIEFNVAQKSSLRLQLFHPFVVSQVLGVIDITPNYALIEQNARKNALVQGMFLASLILILAVIIAALVYRFLSKPLNRLAIQVGEIDPADPMQITEGIHRKDELGKLVTSINKLARNLRLLLDSERAKLEDAEQIGEKFRLIFEKATLAMILLSDKNEILMANAAFKALFKLEDQQSNILNLFANASRFAKVLRDFRANYQVKSIEQLFELNPNINSDVRWVSCTVSKQSNEADAALELIIKDVTHEYERQKRIEFEANHDVLTALKNRRAAIEYLENKASAESNSLMYIGLIDLDGFKPVNDNYGHDAGDLVLIEIAKRITALTDSNALIARWGGDEFLVAGIVQHEDEIKHIIAQYLASINIPIALNENTNAQLGASIGVVSFVTPLIHIEKALYEADIAMYQAKRDGKNRIELVRLSD